MNNLPQTPASVRLSVAKADGTAIATVTLSLTEDKAGIGLQINGAEEAAKLQPLVDLLRERCKGAIDAGDTHASTAFDRSSQTSFKEPAMNCPGFCGDSKTRGNSLPRERARK